MFKPITSLTLILSSENVFSILPFIANSQYLLAMLKNEKKKGQIKIVKQDAEKEDIKLEGVKFQIIDINDKVVEEVGEEKEKVIREKANTERINQQVMFHEDGIVHTGDGNTLFFEPISKTVFKSSKVSIREAVNKLNWNMTYGNEPYAALSDFYDAIKIPEYALGNELGWRTDKGLIDISFELAETNAGEPCFSLNFLVPPEWDFDNLYG